MIEITCDDLLNNALDQENELRADITDIKSQLRINIINGCERGVEWERNARKAMAYRKVSAYNLSKEILRYRKFKKEQKKENGAHEHSLIAAKKHSLYRAKIKTLMSKVDAMEFFKECDIIAETQI